VDIKSWIYNMHMWMLKLGLEHAHVDVKTWIYNMHMWILKFGPNMMYM